ncbi:hypothetical protein IRY55_02955 [Savagea sp. SN6]|uniref:Uncharacterized protein n=1 Tax=Savagea serpentis TaxID=2785297 RepID=A0A8J7G258_9BACL|nr:hypothetical protein [Savagea serpentis]MBF4500312.1 hypothetical protein [Savagea serpentis]
MEIIESIETISIDDIQLNRMCGIPIDYAMEASIQTAEPFVRMAFI